jgi:hypothetical protein
MKVGDVQLSAALLTLPAGRWYCKYVRREIRALTDEDRESYFQAMEVIYSTTQEEGERLYGRNFVSLEQLILMVSTTTTELLVLVIPLYTCSTTSLRETKRVTMHTMGQVS